MPSTRRVFQGSAASRLCAAALLFVCCVAGNGSGRAAAQAPEGHVALEAFDAWRRLPANAALTWTETLARYRIHLLKSGLSPEEADRALRLALAHHEGALYDKAYSGVPEFRTEPNRLLMEAVDGRKPGRALDAGMGQGRNALALARLGWDVSGFDVSAVGLAFRVKAALRPGGLVVVEAAHREASGAEWEFESNELLRIFEGFTILKYEELMGAYDWAPGKPVRMVRLVAQKPG